MQGREGKRREEKDSADEVVVLGSQLIIGKTHIHRRFAVQQVPTYGGHHADFFHCNQRPGSATRSSKDQP